MAVHGLTENDRADERCGGSEQQEPGHRAVDRLLRRVQVGGSGGRAAQEVQVAGIRHPFGGDRPRHGRERERTVRRADVDVGWPHPDRRMRGEKRGRTDAVGSRALDVAR